MAKKKMHKEPAMSDIKGYITHESKESDSMERKERNLNPKAEEGRQQAMADEAHLKPGNSKIDSKRNKQLTNDTAHFLYHPQLAPEHKCNIPCASHTRK